MFHFVHPDLGISAHGSYSHCRRYFSGSIVFLASRLIWTDSTEISDRLIKSNGYFVQLARESSH